MLGLKVFKLHWHLDLMHFFFSQKKILYQSIIKFSTKSFYFGNLNLGLPGYNKEMQTLDFFHLSTLQKRSMSRSSTLRDSDGIWHTDELLHIHIKSFFLKLFNFSPHQLPNITTNVFKQLPYNPLFFFFFFLRKSFNSWRPLLMIALYHQTKTPISF